MWTGPFKLPRRARAQHFIGAASIEIKGERAIAETRMILMVRGRLQGAEVDVTCYGRFYDRLVKHAGHWRIQRRVPIYEKDRLDPLDPGAAVTLDAQILSSHPDGYRHLAYLQSSGGASITAGLPIPNSPPLFRRGPMAIGRMKPKPQTLICAGLTAGTQT